MRIITDQPSTGKPTLIRASKLPAGTEQVPVWTNLLEAPDFSIPIREEEGYIEGTRQIVPGAVLVISPLMVTNVLPNSVWVQLRMVSETDVPYFLTTRIVVPGNETIQLPTQGQTLLKMSPTTVNGDRLQIAVGTADAIDVYGAASESEADSHAPDTESAL